MVPLTFAAPRYLLLYSNGSIAVTEEVTDELLGLLAEQEVVIVDMEEISVVEVDKTLSPIPHMEDLEWD